MTPSKQLFLHKPEEGQIGDCWRTCIACLLNKRPEEVPHFTSNSWGDYSATRKSTLEYLATLGLSCIEYPVASSVLDDVLSSTHLINPYHYFILSGNSKNGTGHSVICLDSRIVWDPSLDDSGIVGPMSDGYFWISWLVTDLHLVSSSTRKDSFPTSRPERILRRMLAARVGMPNTYFDDGEAQGQEHGISIDFMRDSIEDLDVKMWALNVARNKASQEQSK